MKEKSDKEYTIKMKLFMYLLNCSLILTSLALISEGCGRGAIKIQNNGYKDVVVAIGDKVAEDSHLLDRIKQVFTEASAVLYTATRWENIIKTLQIWP